MPVSTKVRPRKQVGCLKDAKIDTFFKPYASTTTERKTIDNASERVVKRQNGPGESSNTGDDGSKSATAVTIERNAPLASNEIRECRSKARQWSSRVVERWKRHHISYPQPLECVLEDDDDFDYESDYGEAEGFELAVARHTRYEAYCKAVEAWLESDKPVGI
jgi:hypothetical protein